MRPAIHNGAFVPPRSLVSGEYRLRQLPLEIHRIRAQLDDRSRVECSTPEHYAAWRKGAENVLAWFRQEQGELEAWLARRRDGEALLREVWEMLKAMEREVDFEPAERALMERLRAHFNKETHDGEGQAERRGAG